MNIEWHHREDYQRAGTTTWFAKIEVPSNIRRADANQTFLAAAVTREEDGLYRTSFVRFFASYFDIPRTRLHTEKGAKRRVEKYLTLWAVAGYPTGDEL